MIEVSVDLSLEKADFKGIEGTRGRAEMLHRKGWVVKV